jgi:hypothetical protein
LLKEADDVQERIGPASGSAVSMMRSRFSAARSLLTLIPVSCHEKALVRISAQLVSGKDGGHLWADRYDPDLTDIFAIQDEVTHEIVTKLTVKLLPERDRAREWATRAPLGRRRNRWLRPVAGVQADAVVLDRRRLRQRSQGREGRCE